MAFRAVLDANVLYPFSLRDALVRLAVAELYDAFWSARILDEMTRNLVKNGHQSPAGARRLVTLMRQALDAAEVPEQAIAQLEPAMSNDEKDRHVLAAAVAAHAEAVVTCNLRHFPPAACEPLRVEAVHPDEFLLVLHAKHPETVLAVLQQQAAELKRPPISLGDLLDMLSKTVPQFAGAIRAVSDELG